LEQLTLTSRRITAGTVQGERRSKKRGQSADFADYRNYVPGDDTRFLDWKLYGRLDKLFIKRFLEEEDLRLHILVDTSSSMNFGDPDKQRYAFQMAAALGYLALARQDQVSVIPFSEGLAQQWGPKRGKAHAPRLFNFLENLPTEGGTQLDRALRQFSLGTRGKGLVVVISDFYDFNGFEQPLRQLFARNFEVIGVQVLSPQELDPEYEGDLKLVDQELPHLTTDISMGPRTLHQYKQTLDAFTGDLRDYLTRRGGTYLAAPTSIDCDRLILRILRNQGVVR